MFVSYVNVQINTLGGHLYIWKHSWHLPKIRLKRQESFPDNFNRSEASAVINTANAFIVFISMFC